MHFDRLKRRQFITLLGGASAWPLAARAQQPDRVRRIGVLTGATAANDPDLQARNRGEEAVSPLLFLKDNHAASK